MKKYLLFIYLLILLLIIATYIKTDSEDVYVEDFHTKWIAYQKMYKPKCIEIIEEVEPVIEQIIEEPIVETNYTTRMTSYYPEEGETTTATGLGINNFGVNEKGWFTYNGKLVVATASTRLGYTTMRTYNLYDEITLNIDGIDYQAIVLDVCGACQKDNRIDLFVSSVIYARDTMIEVKE